MMLKVLTALAAIVVSVQPAFSATLIVKAEQAKAAYDDATGQPVVDIRLSAESRAAFADFTKARVSETIQIRLGSKVLMAPMIIEPIAGGVLRISGTLTESGAQGIVEGVKAADGNLEIDGSDK